MNVSDRKYNVEVSNLDELYQLMNEAKILSVQLCHKQERIVQWQPVIVTKDGNGGDNHSTR